MFAEELGGNASRKRAEEAKERRKRLKELQQKKAAAAATTSVSGAANGVQQQQQQQENATGAATVTTSMFPAAVPVTPLQQQPMTTTSSTSTASSTRALTAVEKAAEQRQWRATQASQQQGAAKVQAMVRAVLSRIKVRRMVAKEMEQRLSDMETLRAILLKKKSATAAATCMLPSATATALLRQFLFVSSGRSSITRKEFLIESSTSTLLGQLLEYVVLPGLEAGGGDDDVNAKNPLAPWIESSVGCFRLRRFLSSLLSHYYYSTMQQQKSAAAILRCLQALLLGTSPLQLQCRGYMLIAYNAFGTGTTTTARRDDQGEAIDLIASLRHHLLCLRDKPIPADAEDKRDACFTAADKNRAGGALMQLLLDAVAQDSCSQQIQSRVVTDLLTIPLLAWRLHAATISRLVSPASPQLLLITLLQAFTSEFAAQLYDGRIEELLVSPDLPLTICGATGTQRLLANILQLGRLIPACNGTVVSRQDFATATAFFQAVAALVSGVPVGTFLSSRESAIAWMSVDGGNQKPIVLSPIILEQCKALLVDSYVRRVFQSAMDTTCLQTDQVLAAKNDKDLKHEKDLIETGNSSAASLAAKEARVDRNKSFWNSSKWARKLTKGVTSLLVSDATNGSTTKRSAGGIDTDGELFDAVAAGLLQDTSSVSRLLAEGNQKAASASSVVLKQQRRSDEYSPNLLLALTRTYSILLARWGGGGNDDIVAGSATKHQRQVGLMERAKATTTQEAWVKSFLNVLCFSTPIVRVAWGLIQSDDAIVADIYDLIDSDRVRMPLRSLNIQPDFLSPMQQKSRLSSNHDGAALLYLFLCTFSHVLIITDDVEIHDMDRPLPIHQIRRCIQILKKLLYRATCIDKCSPPSSTAEPSHSQSDGLPNYFGLALISASSRTMRDLYDRSSRRPICVPNLWIVSGLMEKEISHCKKFEDYQSLLSTSAVLQVCPYMVSFKRRLKLFERVITTSRVEIQGENSSNPFHTNPLKPGIPVRITRGRLLEDGIATMNNLGTNMRQRISVQYYNEAGTRESGIDAGGLFKEFWTDLCAIAFDPNYALFRVTDSGTDGGVGNCLYPNPSSAAAHGTDHITLFAFLGRILGKALYEGITIHPKFAHFFLSFLKGDYNFLHMLPDLSTVDSQLYNNLMFLKTYDGDAADLSLTFTVTVDEFGGTKEIPLIPNGANVDVTDSNKQLYIGLVAKFYVYDRIREQSEAMTQGLFEVVNRSWLRIFNEPELQVLISGASDGKLDVEDMKAHCHYAGGYSSIDRTVSKFWKVVASLDEKQQGALLRFVTSCERPPPLGFGSMNPPFTIHRVGILRDGDRLPTSSTCFNVLKLPTYSSEKVLRERLIYAIESGAGFELT